MTDKPPVVQQPSNAGMNPSQFAQPPGFGQQQPNMGYGGFGQQPMNMGFGQQQMSMGFGQQQFQNPHQQGTQLIASLPPVIDPPPPVPGVPVGLEPLLHLTHVFVKQQIEILEVTLHVETPNRYDVIGGNGQKIYLAVETTPAIYMQYPGRPFTIDIIDFFGRRVMNLSLVSHHGYCANTAMLVTLGDGTKLGEVEIFATYCNPIEFRIKDSTGEVIMTIMRIKVPSDTCYYSKYSTDFPISTATKEKSPLGVIRKTFAGHIQEYLTDADNFGVEFPGDMDIRWKVLMFAAVFLIDFMFFESTAGYPYGVSRRHSH